MRRAPDFCRLKQMEESIMLGYIRQEANRTYTENGALTNRSTGSDCLDLFSSIGALRRSNENEIITRFERAYHEDPDLAMKILFYARDIRGGLGERRVFRIILRWLADNEPMSVMKNLENIAEYGRFDDLLSLMGTSCEKEMIEHIAMLFNEDLVRFEKGESISLLAKWLPSVNASNGHTVRFAKKIAREFGMTEAGYRKALTKMRARIRIIENNLREKDYSFDYEKQPSRALFKYRKAFIRNDGKRYDRFLSLAGSGEARLHADNIAPYELIEPYLNYSWYGGGRSFMRKLDPEEEKALNVTWGSLPDFGGTGNALVVIDTSGPMYCQWKPLPAAVALSLGLYFAERNRGPFGNHFIEFSARPQLIEIKGETFTDRLHYVASFNEIADTNLESVFDLILNAAVRNNVKQEELPERLIIISDMEFNSCITNASVTNYENARRKYEDAGYKLPGIVFWNVASRNRQVPVTTNDEGTILVSGATPRLFQMVIEGVLSPYSFMMKTLNNRRYEGITA